jgi:glycosyltransferase involved in cell wall biosynthesis
MADRPLHIAVNTRLLLPNNLEGIGRFADEVLQRVVAQHPEAQFTFLFDRPFDPRFVYGPNVRAVVTPPPARHPLLYVMYFEGALAWRLRQLKPDVFFSPDGYLSLSAPRSLPQVPVFHDLAFVHYPQYIDAAHRWHYGRYFPRFAQRAAQILTVSGYTAQDLQDTWSVAPERISVVHCGASQGFRPHTEAEQTAVRTRFSQGAPYFLYVGAIQPRKNVASLLRAFDAFKAQTGLPHRLLLTGRMAWKTQDVVDAYAAMQHQEAVSFTGFVTDAELAALYSAAVALTYVSNFEGFGLPILEAQYAETAVICSNTSSMPEVAGPAALLVSPADIGELANAMQLLATQPELRQQLIGAGRTHRQYFTWDQTAAKAWAALETVAVNRM